MSELASIHVRDAMDDTTLKTKKEDRGVSRSFCRVTSMTLYKLVRLLELNKGAERRTVRPARQIIQ